MDIYLTDGRCNANRLVLQHATETTHRVALEVCEVDHKVVVGQVRANDVVLHTGSVLHGELNLALSVHNIDGRDIAKTVILSHLHMSLGRKTGTLVSGIALNDRTIHLLYQSANQFGFEVVFATRLTGADLHSHATRSLTTQSLINLHQTLRRDVGSHIHLRQSRLLSLGCGVATRATSGRYEERSRQNVKNFHKSMFFNMFRMAQK